MSTPSSEKPLLLRRSPHFSTCMMAMQIFSANPQDVSSVTRFGRNALFEPRVLRIIDTFTHVSRRSVTLGRMPKVTATAVAYDETSKRVAVAAVITSPDKPPCFVARILSMDGKLERIATLHSASPGRHNAVSSMNFIDASHLLVLHHGAQAGVCDIEAEEESFTQWRAVGQAQCVAVHRDATKGGAVTAYIGDNNGQCIRVLDKHGKEIRTPFKTSTQLCSFRQSCIAIDGNTLYAVCYIGSRAGVYMFDLDGNGLHINCICLDMQCNFDVIRHLSILRYPGGIRFMTLKDAFYDDASVYNSDGTKHNRIDETKKYFRMCAIGDGGIFGCIGYNTDGDYILTVLQIEL